MATYKVVKRAIVDIEVSIDAPNASEAIRRLAEDKDYDWHEPSQWVVRDQRGRRVTGFDRTKLEYLDA